MARLTWEQQNRLVRHVWKSWRTVDVEAPKMRARGVYRWERWDDLTVEWVPIYIGKGGVGRAICHWSQAMMGKPGHNPAFYAELRRCACKRIDVRVRLLPCRTEAVAFAVEERLIARYRRQDEGGSLFNVAKGGKRGVTSAIAKKAAATRAPYWRDVAKRAAKTRAANRAGASGSTTLRAA